MNGIHQEQDAQAPAHRTTPLTASSRAPRSGGMLPVPAAPRGVPARGARARQSLAIVRPALQTRREGCRCRRARRRGRRRPGPRRAAPVRASRSGRRPGPPACMYAAAKGGHGRGRQPPGAAQHLLAARAVDAADDRRRARGHAAQFHRPVQGGADHDAAADVRRDDRLAVRRHARCATARGACWRSSASRSSPA